MEDNGQRTLCNAGVDVGAQHGVCLARARHTSSANKYVALHLQHLSQLWLDSDIECLFLCRRLIKNAAEAEVDIISLTAPFRLGVVQNVLIINNRDAWWPVLALLSG